MYKLLSFITLSLFFTSGFAQVSVTTLAGTDTAGYRNGADSTALFNSPTGVAADTMGNVYVADSYNNVIRKISATGTVTTFAGDTAGYRDGNDSIALFRQPLGICTDLAGNVYVADTYNHCIRKISATGVVTTLAGRDSAGYENGPAGSALFNLPVGVAADTAGNIYVTDNGNNVVRKISVSGTVTTLAGNDTLGYRNGADTSAEFFGLGGIAVDNSGAVYVTEYQNNSVRKISNGVVSNIGGYDTLGPDSTNYSTYPGYVNGAADTSRFNNPMGIVVDNSGNVFVCDEYNNVIREISNGIVSTYAGTGSAGFVNGPDSVAEFFSPVGLALDKKGTFYVADDGNNAIRRIGLPMPLGIAPIVFKESYISAYPIPCTDNLTIASAPEGPAVLFDITGKLVWSAEHLKAPYTLNTSGIMPGVYFLRMGKGMQTAVKKIIIQR